MAAARAQVARHLRAEPDVAEAGFAREVVADAPRSPTAEETPRRPAEMPGSPAAEKPAPAIKPAIAPAADAAASKSGKRKKMILIGVGVLLALGSGRHGGG